VQIALVMNLKTRAKLPEEVLKIIDEVAREWETHSMATSMNDHDWGLEKLRDASVKIKVISPEAKVAWANELKDWPNERAQAVKNKKGIDMPKILRAFIQYNKDAGHNYPVDYVIKD
jgi:TRAP-type C4-dicarboxylate transport system substrate-binding protein